MRNLLAMIGRVMRAMRNAAARFKQVTVEVAGKLVTMLVPSGAAAEPEEPEIVEQQPADDFGDRVRHAAASLQNDGLPDPDLLATLPQPIVRWLSICDESMLKSIMRSSDESIRDHVKGRKAIRGVLCADEASVDDYMRALLGRPDMPEEELRSAMAWMPA